MKISASDAFTLEAIERIAGEIRANEGQEVSFAGSIDRTGLVTDLEVMAYGREDAAPVDMMESAQADVVVHNHPSGDLRASQADIELASLLVNRKIGFYIVDNDCEYVNVINKPQPRVYLDEAKVESVFRPAGLLAQAIPQFEPRDEQVEMVKAVTRAVNESEILICEAGTGTGKSLSYLIPAAIWAVENKKRILVSTHTINLQQQIAHKDMEIVNKIVQAYLGQSAPYSILVGRGNYVCKRKLYDILKDLEKQASLFTEEDDADILTEIEKWTRTTDEGARGEFGEYVRDSVWEEIASDGMTCNRKKCHFYTDCFYCRARLDAERSSIIIANHSLVFSSIDENSYKSGLPFFSGIVFDEAHHIEDVALKSLSKEFSFQGLLYVFRKLYRVASKGRDKGRETGLFALLGGKVRATGYFELTQLYDALLDHLRAVEDEVSAAFSDVTAMLGRVKRDSNMIGVTNEWMHTPEFAELAGIMESLFMKVKKLTSGFDGFLDQYKQAATDESGLDVLRSIGFRMASLTEANDVFRQIFETENDPSAVKWIEVSQRNVRFAYSPLEVGDFLAHSLFTKKEFTVFTSATVMINKSFDYFKSGAGVFLASNKTVAEVSLPSPFDYKNQAEIYILNEALEHSRHTAEKTDLVKELCLVSGGGVLVLFTSYVRLQEMFAELKDILMENGLLPIKQGDKTRKELLDIMKTRDYVVLFATSSFWEGIDIQGDNLRCVVIEKIPFDNPSDPIYKAKVELLESKGIPSFAAYSIPRAALRLKQGIGRLIRSKTDRGVIVILDNRMKTKSYGAIFLNSLPPCDVVYNSSKVILREAERFFVEWNRNGERTDAQD